MRRPTLSLLAVTLSTACGTGADPQQLERLNQELALTPYYQAITQTAHFSPLCDEQGYPLVGNIVSKGGTTATELCAVIREPKR